jgi:PLP dependent protein
MSNASAQIAENVVGVRGRIAEAAARSGRAAGDVTLVAVTKFVLAETVRWVVEAGCHDLGESRPQELWQKAPALGDLPIRWHLVGHLQRNKVRRTLPLVAMIHSIDSQRLLAAVEEEAAVQLPPQHGGGADILVCPGGACSAGELPVLLEVNVSGETAKHGLKPEEVEPLLAELASSRLSLRERSVDPAQLSRSERRQIGADDRKVAVRGLMCMAALEGGSEEARRDFAALRELRDRLRPVCPPGHTLDELSMGMSGDFEEAIEEGATIVRVGSALFEGVA